MVKRAALELETIIKFILIGTVAAVIFYFIIAFLVKGIGHDTVTPLVNQTSKNVSGAFGNLFG